MTKRRGKFLLAALICLVLCFIWGNSMLSGEESGAVSGGLLDWLTGTSSDGNSKRKRRFSAA